jgi:hypothetical protein
MLLISFIIRKSHISFRNKHNDPVSYLLMSPVVAGRLRPSDFETRAKHQLRKSWRLLRQTDTPIREREDGYQLTLLTIDSGRLADHDLARRDTAPNAAQCRTIRGIQPRGVAAAQARCTPDEESMSPHGGGHCGMMTRAFRRDRRIPSLSASAATNRCSHPGDSWPAGLHQYRFSPGRSASQSVVSILGGSIPVRRPMQPPAPAAGSRS